MVVKCRGFRALIRVSSMIITIVFICILGYSTYAAAGDGKCFMMAKKYEAALEKLMKKHKRFRTELKRVSGMTKKSAKKYDTTEGQLETFMKDKDISKAEAKKISKMDLKFDVINGALLDLEDAIKAIKPDFDRAMKYSIKFTEECR